MAALARDDHDERLIAAVAQGDERALGELYDRFSDSSYGLALRVVRDRHLAEDAVQDAFLSVWRSARRFDGSRGSVRAWILMLVHRRSVDLAKLHDRHRGPYVAEIADRLDHPLGTIKSQTFAGLQRLRCLLSQTEPPSA